MWLKEKKMKKLLLGILTMITSFLLFYLIGSFYSITFDIQKWTEGTRFMVGIGGGIMSMFFGVAVFFNIEFE